MNQVLVTGGLGYIGSHTAVELIDSDYEVVILDNLSNSKKSVLDRIEQIAGKKPDFYECDLKDKRSLNKIFDKYNFDAVIHFAGLKSVGESVKDPLRYYRENIVSTLNLCDVMKDYRVKRLVFSSSATVYGTPSELPLSESSRVGVGITNPYGQTKFMIEQMLKDLKKSDGSWNITLLRYFNPIGAHGSGLIGEDPNSTPNNLLPYVAQVAAGKLEKLRIFGNDYDTPDGTGVRDYIHVVDLAKGHLAAIKNSKNSSIKIYNLGTSKGTSVLELVNAFEKVNNVKVPYEIVERRPGDVAICYADAKSASNELGWRAKSSIEDACRDTWKWQQYARDNDL